MGRLSDLRDSFPASAKAQVIAGVALVVIMVLLISFAASHLRSPDSQVMLGGAFGAMGTGVSLLAAGLAERGRYVASTAVLDLDEREGISPQVLGCPPGGRRCYRITAMIANRGAALARRVRATLTLEPLDCKGDHRDNDARGPQHQTGQGSPTNSDCKRCSFDCCKRGGEILDINKLRSYFRDTCQGSNAQPLVNGVASLRIKEELLSWAVPESQSSAPGRPSYGYETSIAPGQVARLHLFDIFELEGPGGKGSGAGHGGPEPSELEVDFHSEYDVVGPPIYRACVRLSGDMAIRATVRVFGEGVRRPLVVTMCLRPECLEALLKRLRECSEGAKCTIDDLARASRECLNVSSRPEG